MDTCNIRKARAQFSALIEKVQSGETISITKHGRRIACQKAPKTSKKSFESLKGFRDSIKVSGRPLSEIVIEDRKKER